MNINKVFKFEKRSYASWRSMRESFDVFHRDSGDCVCDVTSMWGDRGLHGVGGHDFWQAQRNGKTFDASTRAGAVRGLVNRDLRLLVIQHLHQELKAAGAYNIRWGTLPPGADPAVMKLAPRKS